jgi:hypothetical protein
MSTTHVRVVVDSFTSLLESQGLGHSHGQSSAPPPPQKLVVYRRTLSPVRGTWQRSCEIAKDVQEVLLLSTLCSSIGHRRKLRI